MFTNLVVCAGHAVFRGIDFSNATNDFNWHLKPFQKGEPALYLEHIQKSVTLAKEDPESLLVFSGGQTCGEAGPMSEAVSYWRIANHFGWLWTDEVSSTWAICEEYARDSYENLIFSIARFREYTGTYPRSITVVGWEFKRERFDFHREAIRFPFDRFTYVGANNPMDLEVAQRGEAKALSAFMADPYGTGKGLMGKRLARDPFLRGIPYPLTAPELVGLFGHGGPERFKGDLPW